MSDDNRAKRAVVLSGGGANGAYEAGCLRAVFGGHSPATGKRPFEEDYLPNTLETMNRFIYVAVANMVRQDIEEVRKVNEQAEVAQRITPIVNELENRTTAQQRARRSSELKKAIERAETFVAKLAKRERITVHCHYPSKALGGVLGLLDFTKSRMREFVDLGFDDAVQHDCKRNRCVLPTD